MKARLPRTIGGKHGSWPGEADYWFATDHATERFFANLVADDESGDASASYVATMLYLAVGWHVQERRPATPALVRAVACLLGLATTMDGVLVPGRALRPVLALPGHYNLPAFLAAARAGGNDRQSNAALGRLVGVSHVTIGSWRTEMGQYANAASDCFFPLGIEHVPPVTPPNLRTLASDATRRRERRETNLDQRRRRSAEDLPLNERLTLMLVLLQSLRQQAPIPRRYAVAVAAVFGLTSTKAGNRPLPDIAVIRSLGFPDVPLDELDDVLLQARQDGAELAETTSPPPAGWSNLAAWWAALREKAAQYEQPQHAAIAAGLARLQPLAMARFNRRQKGT